MSLLRVLSRRRSEFLLLALSSLLALGLAEVVVRLAAPQPLPEDRSYQADPELGWTPLPSYQGVLGNVVEFTTAVRTNRLGMRGGEPEGRRPAILGLGDSFVFGYGVEEDETVLAHAARELGGEALNGGVAGYDVCQAIGRGLQLLPELDPDVVVLGIFLGNDETDAVGGPSRMVVHHGSFVERWREADLRSWRRRILHPLFARSHLVRFLRWSPLTEAVEVHLLGRTTPRMRAHRGLLAPYLDPPPPEVVEGDRLTRECLPRLRQAAEDRGLPLLAVLIPERLEVYPQRLAADVEAAGFEDKRFDLDGPNRRFKAMLDEAGIAYYDPRPRLRAAAAAGRRLYYEVDLHLDAEGSRELGRILAEELRPTVAPPPAPDPPSGGDAPSCVVLYLIDTLRLDRLGCFGSSRGLTPAIDAFARDAHVFRALAQATWTRPAVTSVFVGQWPWRHGVNGRQDSLGASALTLAELLSAAGYHTVAMGTNDQVSPQFGLGQGFDDFRLLSGEERYLEDSSGKVGDAAARWLEQERDAPFFLFLHTIDPHAPYSPADRFRRRFAPGVEEPSLDGAARAAIERIRRRRERRGQPMTGWDLGFGSVPWMIALDRGEVPATAQIAAGLSDLYDAEVAANDEQFGRLIAQLRRLGLYDDCTIVLLSDHGEEFAEHGGWLHGNGFFAEALDVPLLVKPPGGRRESVASGRAQQIDVLPTILDLAGLAPPPGVEGVSLLRPADLSRRPAFAYLGQDGKSAVSVVAGRWKLVRFEKPRGWLALYDLVADPGETTDVAWAQPLIVRYLQRLVRERLAEPTTSLEVEIDAATRERLEALGYL